MKDLDPQGKFYRIGAVANLTGLSTHTIRAWERRYGMDLSGRSDGGTRLYPTESLERLMVIKKLLDQGESISMLCNLTNEELEERLSRFPGAKNGSEAPPMAVKPKRDRRLRIVAYGNTPLTQDHYKPSHKAEISIDLKTKNEHELSDFLKRNEEKPDIGLLFFDLLPQSHSPMLSNLLELSPNTLWVIVFNLGSGRELISHLDRGIKAFRGPIPEMVLVDLLYQMAVGIESLDFAHESESTAGNGPIFNESQLSQLSEINSSIQCECPSHMSTIINSLNAFEKYCNECENTSPQDAALHKELGQQTARARSIMEQMLVKVCAYDNIRIS